MGFGSSKKNIIIIGNNQKYRFHRTRSQTSIKKWLFYHSYEDYSSKKKWKLNSDLIEDMKNPKTTIANGDVC